MKNALFQFDKNQLIDFIMTLIDYDDMALALTQLYTANESGETEYGKEDILDKMYEDIDNVTLFYIDGFRFIPDQCADEGSC